MTAPELDDVWHGIMAAVRRDTQAILARIVEGKLNLTMADMRRGTDFETASCCDIRWSFLPIYRARKIVLVAPDGRERVLKDK